MLTTLTTVLNDNVVVKNPFYNNLISIMNDCIIKVNECQKITVVYFVNE